MSSRYPAEFKQKAVELVTTQRKSIAQVSLEIGRVTLGYLSPTKRSKASLERSKPNCFTLDHGNPMKRSTKQSLTIVRVSITQSDPKWFYVEGHHSKNSILKT